MAVILVLLLLATTTVSGQRLEDLTRRDTGDTFTLTNGDSCSPAQCAEHGAGAWSSQGEGCACACPQRAPLFREDRELCVDDLPECSLATFGTGNGVQRIPFVFLPLRGQIIHPSREITFKGVKTPICAVSGAQFLTRKGFVDLRNTLDSDVPFSLFRDEGRTFLQWSGEDELRLRMSGRVMIVRLLCRDVAAAPSSPLDLRGVFTPCVAFRVQGTPPRHISNVTEVQFAPNAQTSESTSSGLSVSEYVAIGISSLLLGLIYVASVFLYLHLKKRKKLASEEENTSTRKLKGLKKKDGTLLTEHDIVRINNERVQTITNAMVEEDGIVKKNPLLTIGRQLHDIRNSFPSDSGSNISDSEDFLDSSSRNDDNKFKNQTISAIIHPQHREVKIREEVISEPAHREESGIERLPDEHVSIVETIDDRDIPRPVGTTRRKLYFNPAYFEPHLMAEPPPAALEFLVKIREVIAIAKHKMAAKRFHPVLNEIPEEETYPSNGNSLDIYQGLGSQKSGSFVSLKRENSRKSSVCVGCPGCKSDDGNSIKNVINYNVPACSNCVHNRGDKQSSIRKWLENIPTAKQPSHYNEFPNINQNNSLVHSLLSLPTAPKSEIKTKLKKQYSFTASQQPLRSSDNFYIPKKSSTLSVRSEPPIRNYNLPLPDFEPMDYVRKNYYGQTISRVDDIRPIGLNSYQHGSVRRSIRINKFITNKNVLPDMVNEAIALEHCAKNYQQSSSDEEKFHNKVSNANETVTRKNSESLPEDYETDSLERLSHKKGFSTPTEYADITSSQASPSLSNALPLEEELTMRNAVYKDSNSTTPSPFREVHIKQNLYETIVETKPETRKIETNSSENENSDYSLVSEVYVNNNYNFGSTPTSPSGSDCSMGSRKRNIANNSAAEEKPGCLTIEVMDSPENYIKIHESDGFEPDTLDRKHQKQKELLENVQFSRKELINSLNTKETSSSPQSQRIQLRSSGTFKKPIENSAKFNSLRHIYEPGKNSSFERPVISTDTFSRSTKSLDENANDSWDEAIAEWSTEEGRILTLELRHSKRQRQCTPPTIKQLKNLARPDVLPPLPPTEDIPIYEQPSFPPRKVECEKIEIDDPKNLNGRSLSPRTYMKNMTIDHVTNLNSLSNIVTVGSPCNPMSASVQSQHSDYENINPFNCYGESSKSGDIICRNSSKRRCSKSLVGINTNTFVKSNDAKTRFRRKKGSHIEDSGYLSSDSASSRQVQRRIVIPKLVSCSESDDSENEARSESGAESVETHSVFFGSYRKQQVNESDFDRTKRELRNSSRKYDTKMFS